MVATRAEAAELRVTVCADGAAAAAAVAREMVARARARAPIRKYDEIACIAADTPHCAPRRCGVADASSCW
jgi:hypothetical protein